MVGQPPVDLAHLSRQTGGDRALEREVLVLFQSRSLADLDRLRQAGAEGERREVAHSIVGSARAIGATEVARLAAAVEHGDGDPSVAMAELAAAIEDARHFVRLYLSR